MLQKWNIYRDRYLLFKLVLKNLKSLVSRSEISIVCRLPWRIPISAECEGLLTQCDFECNFLSQQMSYMGFDVSVPMLRLQQITKHSSRMRTTHLPTVRVVVATTRRQYEGWVSQVPSPGILTVLLPQPSGIPTLSPLVYLTSSVIPTPTLWYANCPLVYPPATIPASRTYPTPTHPPIHPSALWCIHPLWYTHHPGTPTPQKGPGTRHIPPEGTWDQAYPIPPQKGHNARHIHPPIPEQNDRNLWKYYLSATS